jgi:hypothetical protein
MIVRGGIERARTSVARRIARPDDLPLRLSGRCEQRLGHRPQIERVAEIHEQQSIAVLGIEPTDHQRAFAEHCAVQVARTFCDRGIRVPQP